MASKTDRTPRAPAKPAPRGRSARAVIADHLRSRRAGDLDGDLERNYDPDVVVMSARGVYRGYDGVRESAHLLWKAVPDADDYTYDSILVDDRMALLEWRAKNDGLQVSCGVDAYLIEDGMIKGQTIHYRVENDELSVSATALTRPGETGPSSDGDENRMPGLMRYDEIAGEAE
jgi:hypothetical protein